MNFIQEINYMSFEEILIELRSRGEYNIYFHEDGRITSKHGKYTLNSWIVQDEELKCVDCKTIVN